MRKIIYNLPHFIIYQSYKYIFPNKFKIGQLGRKKVVGAFENSLRGFDKHKCIFIHIPKAGGVSIAQNLFGDLGGGHTPIYNYYTVYSPQEFNDYFKFAIVRNPWDRLVSAYYFLKEGGFNSVDRNWYADNLSIFENFEDFIMNWVNNKNIFSFTHFIPQYHFLCLNNNILVDKVYKLENMEEIYTDLNKRLSLNISSVHKNKTKNREADYRKYYNKRTAAIVANVYKKDIQLFNYKF